MNYSVNYNYLRKKKAEQLKLWHDEEFVRHEPSFACYNEGYILPLKTFPNDELLFGRGGVIDADGNYIESSAICGRVQFGYEVSRDVKYDDKKVVYCGYLVNHWGHFLIEAVSRLWYFLENDKTIDKYVFFINYGEKRECVGSYREFFELLGVWDKIEIINKPTKYREIVVPELGYKWRTWYSQKIKNMFEKVSSSINTEGLQKHEKILLTRSKFSAHDLDIGIDVVDELFSLNGYKIISPEKLTLSEQIFYIKNADVVATISGSLPHNMLFGNDNQKLIIIERNVLNNEIQADINRIKNLDVTYVDGNLSVYSVCIGQGPYVLFNNAYLQNFVNENNMQAVDNEKYNSIKYRYKIYKTYMKTYKRIYQKHWYMDIWAIPFTSLFYEAYTESVPFLEPFLSGKKYRPVFEYCKKIARKIIKK